MRSYARIHRLAKDGSEKPEAAFAKLAALAGKSGLSGSVRFVLVGDKGARTHTLEIGSTRRPKRGDGEAAPRLEILTTPATWSEIAQGKLSPLDAFAEGRLRIGGDTMFGTQLLASVADGPGATSICEG